MKRTISYFFLVVSMTLCAAVNLSAQLPSGVKIMKTSDELLSFIVKPTVIGLDTISNVDGVHVVPTLQDAKYVESADGTIRQWIVEFDVIVPSPKGFEIGHFNSSYTVEKSEWKYKFSNEMRTTSDAIVQKVVLASYAGIARDRHIARVQCVVAEVQNGRTTIHSSVTGHMVFYNTALNASSNNLTPISNPSLLSLDVANPDAPWFVDLSSSKVTKAKGGETVQVKDTYDAVYRLKIDKEGVYRISADQLRSAGLKTDAAAALSTHIFSNGGRELSESVPDENVPGLREVPLIVNTNSDGSIGSIVFYASGTTGFEFVNGEFSHFIHHYAKQAGYILTQGGANGLRCETSEPPVGQATQPLTVTGRVFHEEELVNPYTSGSGRRWFGRSIENGGSSTYTTVLPGLVRNGTLKYNFVVVNRGSSNSVITIQENSVPIAQRSIPAVPKYMDMYSVPASGEFDASNMPLDSRSVLKFSYQSVDKTATGLLDWYEIHYPRSLKASDGTFEFWTDPLETGLVEYTIGGFGGEVYGFDATDRSNPKLLKNVTVSQNSFTVRLAQDSGLPVRVFVTSNVLGTSIEKISYKNYRSGTHGADVLVITHPSLIPSAESYKTYRTTQDGFKVEVISTQDIFNEYSYGEQDPTGIRNFIADAVRTWSPRPSYVVLWGDGHFDYKNISTQATNFVVPYESLDPDDKDWGLNTYTSDDFYSRLLGADLRPDVAIGRLPVTSNSIGQRVIDKIRAYENSASTDDWRSRITLVADDGATSNGQSDGDLHLSQSETLINYYVPPSFQPKKLYLVEYPTENVASGRRKPAVTEDLLSSVNTSGSIMLNWVGHGNPRVWAHEFVFERETTPSQMTNFDKPFFLTAATCDFARFDLTESQSGAEELLLLPNGGAIGVFSSTRVVFAYQNAELNQEFHKVLFTKGSDGNYSRLGDVLYKVKQKYFAPNDEKYLLLGDPTMRLLIPSYNVKFTTVNDVVISDSSSLRLMSLQAVKVGGFISAPNSTEPDTSYSGVITVSLLDALRKVTVVDGDERNTVNKFTMPGAALNRGTYKVERGRFTAEFVVPKDIAFSSESAKFYGYAYSSDKRSAMGETSAITVNGVADVEYTDDQGPEMKIYMDSRLFLSGGVVRATPIIIVDLEDETGINATGIGVGHDVEASFNRGESIVNLTQSVSTSLENPKAATAQKQIFGLTAGIHTVRVRAWDVLNNVSEGSIDFRIAKESDGIVSSWVSNYPNPFSSSTTIRYHHNVSKPFSASLSIYDQQGRQVRAYSMDVRDMQTAETVWDGADNGGNQLSSGVYLCVIRIDDGSGIVSDVTGKLGLIR